MAPAANKNERFKLASHAFIYGAGREHANMLGGDPNDENDDGCTGAAVAWACVNTGNLTNVEAGDDDSDVLACQWGAKGKWGRASFHSEMKDVLIPLSLFLSPHSSS